MHRAFDFISITFVTIAWTFLRTCFSMHLFLCYARWLLAAAKDAHFHIQDATHRLRWLYSAGCAFCSLNWCSLVVCTDWHGFMPLPLWYNRSFEMWTIEGESKSHWRARCQHFGTCKTYKKWWQRKIVTSISTVFDQVVSKWIKWILGPQLRIYSMKSTVRIYFIRQVCVLARETKNGVWIGHFLCNSTQLYTVRAYLSCELVISIN